MVYQFVNKQETMFAKVKGKTGAISAATHEEHLKWYSACLNKTNTILKELDELREALDPANTAHAHPLYSSVRSLKVELAYAMGGVVNHELYFEILGGTGDPSPGPAGELIDKSFGTFTAFARDLKAAGLASRAWVWTVFDPRTGQLFNHPGDAEDAFPVWGSHPVLALDICEHAYYPDFKSARGVYIDEFLKHIDWTAVNARCERLPRI